MSKKETTNRYLIFLIALFFSALGVSIITRSYLGTSPISGIPFVMSLNTSLSMGTYIFLLNLLLIVLQMLMLGKKGIVEHRTDLVMQLPVSVLFGLFIDMTMWMLKDLALSMYVLKILSLVVGCGVLAFGVSLEVVANVTMLSGEYTVQIASKKFRIAFGKAKIGFDVSLVILAVLLSLLLAQRVDGIREGTIISALITGPFVSFILPRLSFLRQRLSASGVETIANQVNAPTVITISREFGSGGRLIGKRIATNLGIDFYDKELISLVAKESKMSEDFVSENEQNISGNVLMKMILQDYEAPLEKSLSPDDALFVAQSRVIRKLAEKPCVIIGRCANAILSDRSNVINVFLHASLDSKMKRCIESYDIDSARVHKEILRIDSARADHYFHYTGKNWGEARNYHVTFDTSIVPIDTICRNIEELYEIQNIVATKQMVQQV